MCVVTSKSAPLKMDPHLSLFFIITSDVTVAVCGELTVVNANLLCVCMSVFGSEMAFRTMGINHTAVKSENSFTRVGMENTATVSEECIIC